MIPAWEFTVEISLIAVLRKRYLEVAAALWNFLDMDWDAFSPKFKSKHPDGLSDEEIKSLWHGASGYLPLGISCEEAKQIVDPDDVKHMRIISHIQVEGRSLQKELGTLKMKSSGKNIHPYEGKLCLYFCFIYIYLLTLTFDQFIFILNNFYHLL